MRRSDSTSVKMSLNPVPAASANWPSQFVESLESKFGRQISWDQPIRVFNALILGFWRAVHVVTPPDFKKLDERFVEAGRRRLQDRLGDWTNCFPSSWDFKVFVFIFLFKDWIAGVCGIG